MWIYIFYQCQLQCKDRWLWSNARCFHHKGLCPFKVNMSLKNYTLIWVTIRLWTSIHGVAVKMWGKWIVLSGWCVVMCCFLGCRSLARGTELAGTTMFGTALIDSTQSLWTVRLSTLLPLSWSAITTRRHSVMHLVNLCNHKQLSTMSHLSTALIYFPLPPIPLLSWI